MIKKFLPCRLNVPLTGVILFALAISAVGSAQTEPDYGTVVPVIVPEKTLSFNWENVDKYPVVTAVDFMPDGKHLITGGDDCQLCLWDVEKGILLNHFIAHEDWIRGVEVSSDGALVASVGQNGLVKLWNTEDLDPERLAQTRSISERSTFNEKVVGAQGLSFSPDGKKLAISGFESYVAGFEIPSGKVLGKWKMPGTSNTTVAYSPDGSFLAAAGRDGTIRVWDVATKKIKYDLSVSDRRVHTIAFSGDGRLLASGGEDSAIEVWDMQTGQVVAKFETSIGKVYSLCFCGQFLASGDSLNVIRIWDLQSGKEIARGFDHTGTIAAMLYRPETDQLTTAGFDTTIRFWSLAGLK